MDNPSPTHAPGDIIEQHHPDEACSFGFVSGRAVQTFIEQISFNHKMFL